MKVYIAGPIAGTVNGNRDAFAQRAKELAGQGYEPVNPWDIPASHDGPCIGAPVEHEEVHRYGCLLRSDIEVLMHCGGISLLPGWQGSVGARTEYHVARSLGLVFVDEEEK